MDLYKNLLNFNRNSPKISKQDKLIRLMKNQEYNSNKFGKIPQTEIFEFATLELTESQGK